MEGERMKRPARIRGLIAAMAVMLAWAPGTASAADAPPAWTVDTDESRISFVGRQMGAPSEGEFRKFAAEVKFDPENLDASSATVVVDTASASTGNGMIDRELVGPKWFATEQFPTGRFATTGFRALGDGRYEAMAELTLRGITQKVVLPFAVEVGDDPADPGKLAARVSGEVAISRLAYGIGTGEWGDTSIVADAVTVRISLLARRPK